MTEINEAEVYRLMKTNRDARHEWQAGPYTIAVDFQDYAADTGISLFDDDASAWVPFYEVARVLEALKKAITAAGTFTQEVPFDGTGVMEIGRRGDQIGLYLQPVRPATRRTSRWLFTEQIARDLHRALDQARYEIEARFIDLEEAA